MELTIFCRFSVGNCDFGWTSYQGYCYFINEQLQTYEKAKSYCRQQNASLADIQSAAENTFLTKLVPTNLPRGVWIGYDDIAKEGTFIWDRTGDSGIYHNWATTPDIQPDDAGGNEDCVEFLTNRWPNTKGFWNDIPCQWVAASVCEKGR